MAPIESFTIRPARPDDRAAVLALVPRLRAFGPGPLRSPEALDAGEARTLHCFFEAAAADARLWVAEDPHGPLLGAVYAEEATDYFTQEAHGHLGILVVAESAEGHGVGRALLAKVEEWARERAYRFLTLNVFSGNERARAVYERAGYRPDTVRYSKVLPPASREGEADPALHPASDGGGRAGEGRRG
jgi:GNAT superfamily N-acetyltransferase